MKQWAWLSAVIVVLLSGVACIFYWQNLRGVGPAVRPPVTVPGVAGLLRVPSGFSISVLTDKVPGARALVKDTKGNFWVSQTGEGVISQLEIDRDTGAVVAMNPIFRNLRNPHGLALHPQFPTMLYFAEEHRIARVPLYADGNIETILDLPASDGHATRTIGFGPDGRLYVSIGSSCNVCDEKDPRRAKILSLNADGSDVTEYARGLRNAVFFTWHPKTQQLWATDNGRDLLGDDLPPDEVNIVTEIGDYGWPLCYGKNIVDRAFHPDDHDHIVPDCFTATGSHIDIPAHSAPLGLAIVPQSDWPRDWWGDLIVAYHGSWNRSEPTGYKLVRIPIDDQGQPHEIEDFITGWLTSDGEALGRPVGVYIQSDGVLYVTDDKAGIIYTVQYDAQ